MAAMYTQVYTGDPQMESSLYSPSDINCCLQDEQTCQDKLCSNGSSGLQSAADRFEYYCEGYVQPIIFALGIITNIITLVVLRRCKIDNSSTIKVCLLSLALTDVCASTFSFLQLLVESTIFEGQIPYGCWSAGAVASHSLYFLGLMFMCCSAFTVVLMAILRGVAIKKPFIPQKYLTPPRVRALCAAVNFTTFLFFIPSPVYIFWEVCSESYKEDGGCCGEESQFCVKYYKPHAENIKEFAPTYLAVLVISMFPFILITYVICFVIIRVVLSRRQRRHFSDRRELKKQMSRSTNKVTRTLLFILVLDTFCMLPSVIQGLGEKFSKCEPIFRKGSDPYKYFDGIAEMILALRPSYNFFLYVFQYPEFRARLLSMCSKAGITIPTSPRSRMASHTSDRAFSLESGRSRVGSVAPASPANWNRGPLPRSASQTPNHQVHFFPWMKEKRPLVNNGKTPGTPTIDEKEEEVFVNHTKL